MEREEETVEVRFVTEKEEYRVPETPFRVLLKLGRYGLSALINHLLGLDPPKPFDFLINEEFLRCNLGEFLKQKNLSSETMLTIEYVEAFAPPAFIKEYKHEDWVSALESTKNHYLSGSYDSVARVWDPASQKCLVSCSGHTAAITSISILNINSSGQQLSFVTASKDHTIRIWKVDLHKLEYKNTHVAEEHQASVECVTHSLRDPNIVCSGGWDKMIKIWDTKNTSEIQDEHVANKKRKIHRANPLNSKFTLSGHSQCVSAIQWTHSHTIISGSWDHSLRQWDIEAGANTHTVHCGKAVYCLSYNPSLKLIATGHPDKSIKLHDLRSNDTNMVLKNLSSHKGWISSVAFHEKIDHLFISGSHDGTVKVWDLRSTIPLHTLDSNSKILDVTWHQNIILAGGTNNQINTWQM